MVSKDEGTVRTVTLDGKRVATRKSPDQGGASFSIDRQRGTRRLEILRTR